MTILTGSRYMGQTVMSVPTTSGPRKAVFGPSPFGLPHFSYYTVVAGDRLDLIAAKLYGVGDYWWRIADVNPEIFYPDDLVVGSIIRIPTS